MPIESGRADGGVELVQPLRRDRGNIRELLLDAAIVEFAAHGFEGASVTAIAARSDAHQPQINYHFSTKLDLWHAAMDQLVTHLDEHFAGISEEADPSTRFVEFIRRMVLYGSEHPYLNQIVLHEANAPGERLTWIVTFVRPRYQGLRELWIELQQQGVAAPIDPELFHYVFLGATLMPFLAQSEAEAILERPLNSPELLESHISGLIAMFLPNYQRDDRAAVGPERQAS